MERRRRVPYSSLMRPLKRMDRVRKIVINGLQYKQNSSGIGVMIRELFGRYAALAGRECQVILPHDGPGFPGGAEAVRMPWNHSQAVRRMLFQSLWMSRYCRDAVLLITDSKTPFFLPRSCTVVPLITDLAVYRMGEVYPLSRVLWWRMQYHYVKRRAGRFLAISEFTKREIAQILKIPLEKIRVIPCACAPQFKRVEDPQRRLALRKKYDLPERFILFVGNSNPRKNLRRMIRAFDRAKGKSGLPHQLIIAGEQGWKFDREKALEGIEHREAVRFLGYTAEEEMPALYSVAELFVFPTLYEGFGIPVVEAQSCGTPVLTSSCSALPEVGGKGALYVDPYDTQEICDGILRILQDPAYAAELVERGYENAGRFSWTESARLLNETIEGELGP